MPAESPPAGRRPEFDELPSRRRKMFYVFAVGRRSNEQRHTQRYLQVFDRFDKQRGLARFLSWNWSVFFCTLPWLAYRRMPGLALVYFAVTFVFAPLQFFAWQQSCPGEKGIPYAVVLAWLPFTFLVMPAIADWLFHRRARRIAIDASERRYDNKVGTNSSSAAGFAIGGPLVFLILFAQAGNYYPVTHVAQMGEVALAATAARNGIAAFHAAHGRLPDKGEIKVSASTPKVKSLAVADAGVLTVVAGVRCFEGRSILYTPAVTDGRVSWKCSTPDIDFKYLPAECRQRQ